MIYDVVKHFGIPINIIFCYILVWVSVGRLIDFFFSVNFYRSWGKKLITRINIPWYIILCKWIGVFIRDIISKIFIISWSAVIGLFAAITVNMYINPPSPYYQNSDDVFKTLIPIGVLVWFVKDTERGLHSLDTNNKKDGIKWTKNLKI